MSSRIVLLMGVAGMTVGAFVAGLGARSLVDGAIAEAHGYVCGYVASANSFLAAQDREAPTIKPPTYCADVIKRARQRGFDLDQVERNI